MQRLSIAIVFLLAMMIPTPFHAFSAPSPQAPAVSGVFTVNTTDDTPDADQANPACADASGHCSLRAAIMQANFATDVNTITVPSGVYLLKRAGDDDNAIVGDLDVIYDLTIQGAGAGSTIIDGNGAITHDRVMQILAGASVVSLSNLTLRGGVVTGTFAAGGGLLWAATAGGSLRLSHVIIEDNRAYDDGGLALGFGVTGASADLEDVTVRRNTATAAVGGLGVSLQSGYDQFLLRNSQIYSNTAYEGGGLYFDGEINLAEAVRLEADDIYSNTAGLSAGLENHAGFSTNPVLIWNSRVHNNQAGFYGGAIGNYGQLVISNTTLAGNTAGLAGGGIYNYSGSQMDFRQSTISGNAAPTGGGLYGELFTTHGSVLTATNSTFSGNTASHDGAGLYLDGARAWFYNATIASNAIQVPITTSYSGLGGGLYMTHTAIVELQNTILANNTHRYQALAPVADDCAGPLDLLGYNLIRDVTNCSLSGDTINFYTVYDPHLGLLGYNGGPTQTQSPSLGSIVIDTAQNTMPGCTGVGGLPLNIDQRGFARPRGPHCDIGAVEYYPPGPFLPLIRR